MDLRTDLSDRVVVQRLREAADLLDRANSLIQSVYEASDSLYEMHTQLEEMSGCLEAEADELRCIA